MKKVFLVILAMSFAQGAEALTLKEKKEKVEWEKSLSNPETSYMDEFNEKCGYSLPVTFEEKMIPAFLKTNANGAAFCDHARYAMAYMCDDPISKAEIAKKVKRVSCKLGKDREITMKLNNGEFIFTIGVTSTNLDKEVKAFLENNL